MIKQLFYVSLISFTVINASKGAIQLVTNQKCDKNQQILKFSFEFSLTLKLCIWCVRSEEIFCSKYDGITQLPSICCSYIPIVDPLLHSPKMKTVHCA